MFSFFSKLFTTTTLTKTSTVRRYYDEAEIAAIRRELHDAGIEIVRLAHPDEPTRIEKTITPTGDSVIVDGCETTIPQSVRERGPLFLADGPNYESFPSYRHNFIAVSFVAAFESEVFVTINGVRLTRSTSLEGWTRDKVINTHNAIRESAAIDDVNPTFTTKYKDLVFDFHSDDDFLFLSVLRDNGSLVQIHQLNQKQLDSGAERLIISFSYARAILLTLLAANQDISDYVEDDIALLITCLLG